MRVAASKLPRVLRRSDLATSFLSLLLVPPARRLPFLLFSAEPPPTLDFLLKFLEPRLEPRLEMLDSPCSGVGWRPRLWSGAAAEAARPFLGMGPGRLLPPSFASVPPRAEISAAPTIAGVTSGCLKAALRSSALERRRSPGRGRRSFSTGLARPSSLEELGAIVLLVEELRKIVLATAGLTD